MHFTKNKSSYPVQLVVRASKKINSKNYTKKRYGSTLKYNPDMLPIPSEYYARELKRFRRVGKEASAQCPFHDDHNPSFSVNLKSGAFFCFACGARGKSIVGFHMKKFDMSFQRACKDLGVWNE